MTDYSPSDLPPLSPFSWRNKEGIQSYELEKKLAVAKSKRSLESLNDRISPQVREFLSVYSEQSDQEYEQFQTVRIAREESIRKKTMQVRSFFNRQDLEPYEMIPPSFNVHAKWVWIGSRNIGRILWSKHIEPGTLAALMNAANEEALWFASSSLVEGILFDIIHVAEGVQFTLQWW